MTIEKEAADIFIEFWKNPTLNGRFNVAPIEKALQTKQDRIDELEKSLVANGDVFKCKCGVKTIMSVTYFGKPIKEMKNRIAELEKTEESVLNMSHQRIKTLESALKNCLATLELCRQKAYLPFSMQYVSKSIHLAKKAIGGGNVRSNV